MVSTAIYPALKKIAPAWPLVRRDVILLSFALHGVKILLVRLYRSPEIVAILRPAVIHKPYSLDAHCRTVYPILRRLIPPR